MSWFNRSFADSIVLNIKIYPVLIAVTVVLISVDKSSFSRQEAITPATPGIDLKDLPGLVLRQEREPVALPGVSEGGRARSEPNIRLDMGR